MRYKVKTKDCHLIVRARTWFGEEIDEKALDAFSRVYLRGFLKPKVIKKGVIEYTGPVGVSLYERLKKPISKRDFLFIMEQVVVAVQKIESNHLRIQNIVWDLNYTFVNEVTKELQLLYVPSGKSAEGNGLTQYIESIVYSAIPAAESDTEYISRFIYFFKEQKGFNPEKVERFISKEDRSVVNTIKKQNTKQSGFMTDKPQHYYAHYNGDGDSDESTGLLDEDEETGLLEEDGTDYLDDEDETGLLEEETGLLDEDDGTALLIEEQEVHFPSLFRLLTEETISVNKPVFRLGKERSYVDYFVTNNNAVSRSHADIITRGNKYFVIDLNSKNHTYINDQMLPVQVEMEICDGDRLKLGNEEFIFNV